MAKKIRGVMFEENPNNSMGLEFSNLSHRFGYQSPNWPYFEDVKIERIHYTAKSGVLSQRITTSMHNTTHIDAPAHVIQGTPFIDEVPLPHFFGSGIVVSITKKMWEQITYDDMEKAAGKIVRPRDVVIVNTGWHHKYEDSEDYFCDAPGFVSSAGEWFVEKRSRSSATTRRPTTIRWRPRSARSATARSHPHLAEEYKKWSGGRDWKDDFPDGSRCIASCSRTAFSASRTSAATSTRSPADAAHSRSSRGTGTAATVATSALSPSPIQRVNTGSNGEKF